MQVRCLQQAWRIPSYEESTRLQLPSHQHVLLREVELLCEGDIWMYARAAIPAETLVGKYHALKQWGTRPLGEVLFRDPLTTRGAFDITLWQPDHFARRSIFLLDHKPLLLTEVFLPACANRLTDYYAQ
jgi:chorismate--pyruvate lyase